MRTQIAIALKLFFWLTLLTGIVYPVVLTGLSALVFPDKAEGSLVRMNGAVIGSELIGQSFKQDRYFWSRPSAVSYNPMPSGGSNRGPTNLALDTAIRTNRAAFIAANHLAADATVPSEMLTASASGLDPHISPEAAMLQVGRVAAARGLDERRVQALVAQHTEGRQWGVFGEPRVNVLMVNLALDRLGR